MEIKQVFVSHTKKDEKFCDAFDRVCARVGIIAFRSEFEKMSKQQAVIEFIKEGQQIALSVLNNYDLAVKSLKKLILIKLMVARL